MEVFKCGLWVQVRKLLWIEPFSKDLQSDKMVRRIVKLVPDGVEFTILDCGERISAGAAG